MNIFGNKNIFNKDIFINIFSIFNNKNQNQKYLFSCCKPIIYTIKSQIGPFFYFQNKINN